MAATPKPVLALRLKNILFATDFSTSSEAALPFARAIAARFGSTLHLLHVLPPEPPIPVPPVDMPQELDAPLKNAEEQMARLLQRQSLTGVTHEVTIEHGPLWHVFEDTIHDNEIDLVVLGTHGRRGLKKLVLGSVAEEIFRRATCPVLTVGPHIVHDGIAEGHISSILYATDFSTGSSAALAYAIGLARENRARLLLMHVLPDMPEIPAYELEHISDGVRQQLLNLVSPVAGLECVPEPIVLFGSAADAILRIAAEEKAKLIVMGARRRTIGIATEHLPWATAHRVVCEATCPVLTVRR